MKLVKVPDKFDMNIYKRVKANKGCDVCPYCGKKDIKSMIYREKNTGFLGLGKTLNADVYHCYNCGAEWESDLY
jgi:DNA-directed RNA polymerase subunit RPC12/RpoP